jgi:hypothetical protein
MIQSTGLIASNASWIPPNITEAGSLHSIWREWAVHEMTKRSPFTLMPSNLVEN